MKKMVKYLLGVVLAAAAVFAVLLWVLSMTVEGTFDWFKPYYMVYIICGVFGIVSLVYMIFARKRMWGYLGVLLFVPVIIVGFVKNDLPMAIPFIVLLVAGLFLTFALLGIKKWDAGDNQKAGYKTYAQRKAEEQEKLEKEQKAMEKNKQREKDLAVQKAMAEAAQKAEAEFEAKNKK